MRPLAEWGQMFMVALEPALVAVALTAAAVALIGVMGAGSAPW